MKNQRGSQPGCNMQETDGSVVLISGCVDFWLIKLTNSKGKGKRLIKINLAIIVRLKKGGGKSHRPRLFFNVYPYPTVYRRFEAPFTPMFNVGNTQKNIEDRRGGDW